MHDSQRFIFRQVAAIFALEHSLHYSNRPKGVMIVSRPVTKRQGAFKFKPTDKPEQSCSGATVLFHWELPVAQHKMHHCLYTVISQDTRRRQQ